MDSNFKRHKVEESREFWDQLGMENKRKGIIKFIYASIMTNHSDNFLEIEF